MYARSFKQTIQVGNGVSGMNPPHRPIVGCVTMKHVAYLIACDSVTMEDVTKRLIELEALLDTGPDAGLGAA
jgi:hypothetical protein